MAKPTEAEIKKYEQLHKAQFASLVIANNLWLGMPGKYGFNPKITNTRQYKAWYDFGQKIAKLVGSWGVRQKKLEDVPDAKVEKVTPYLGWFLNPAKKQALSDLAMKLVKVEPGKGLGFIPFVVWGIIALIGAFTAAYIIDESTTTAQEKAELMQTTAKTMKELGIPPDKAAEIIQDTQKQATETGGGLMSNLTGGGGTTMLLLLGLGAFLFFKPKAN